MNNCIIELEFKLTEAEGHQGADDSGDEEVKDTTPSTRESVVDTKHFEDEIN